MSSIKRYKISGVYISNKSAFELDRKSSDPEIRKRAIPLAKKKKAEEFLSYPENIQLLKDYFIV